MPRTPAKITQAEVGANIPPIASVVYFVRIGKFIKIGTTTNLESRLSAFRNSSPAIELILAIDGGRPLEQKLHQLLADCCETREIFRPDHRLHWFIEIFKMHGLTRALEFLEHSSPQARMHAEIERRGKRAAEARRTKKEKDEYFAALAADRKRRLGW